MSTDYKTTKYMITENKFYSEKSVRKMITSNYLLYRAITTVYTYFDKKIRNTITLILMVKSL